MIPPRRELPKSWKGLKRYTFDLSFLSPNDPSACPTPKTEILQYLGVQAPGGRESGSSRIIDFDIKFIRTALINRDSFWLWGFKDERGSDCFVSVRLTVDGENILGYDEAFRLTPEQWLVMDYYDEEDWENEE
jgi:hypothetical protein